MTIPKEILNIDNKKIIVSPEQLEKLLHSLDKSVKFRPFNKAFNIPYPIFKLNYLNPSSTLEKAEYVYDYIRSCDNLPTPWSDKLNYNYKEISIAKFIKANPSLFFEYMDDDSVTIKIYIKGSDLYQMVITDSYISIYQYPFHPFDPDIVHVTYPYFADIDDTPYFPSKEELKDYKTMKKDGPLRHEIRFKLKHNFGTNIEALEHDRKIRFAFKVIENEYEPCVKNRKYPLTEYYVGRELYLERKSFRLPESSAASPFIDCQVNFYAKDKSLRDKAKRLNKKYDSKCLEELSFFPLDFYGRSQFNFIYDKSDSGITQKQVELDWKYIRLCYDGKFSGLDPQRAKCVSSFNNNVSATPYFDAYAYDGKPCLTDSRPELGKEICTVLRNDHCFFIVKDVRLDTPERYYTFYDFLPYESSEYNTLAHITESVEYNPRGVWSNVSSFAYDNIQYYDEDFDCFVIPGSVTDLENSGFVCKEYNGFSYVWDNSPFKDDDESSKPDSVEKSELTIPEHIQALMDSKDMKLDEDDDDLNFDW